MEYNFNNNTPIYSQISQILKIKIISGEYPPGDRLPSVRDLALLLKANPNTVQRALSELESEGLIYTERTNGKFVTENAALILKYKSEYANALTREFFESMQKIGFNKADVINNLKNAEETKDGTA